MDETKKASATLAAEKEVPRAALDGILTPKFTFASMQSELPDELFLRYLQEEKDAVEHTTEIWLKNCLPDIAKSRIYYGCVTSDELEKFHF